jgi:hypothetical protein
MGSNRSGSVIGWVAGAGCRSAERAVGPVLVVEGFVLAERVQQVSLVHDQHAVEELGSGREEAPAPRLNGDHRLSGTSVRPLTLGYQQAR